MFVNDITKGKQEITFIQWHDLIETHTPPKNVDRRGNFIEI